MSDTDNLGTRFWSIVYPDENNNTITETLSEKQIIEQYWDYWCMRMKSVGKDPADYTYQDCIEDWVIIHWAWKPDQPDIKNEFT
jgi:hypothetical protein